MARQMTSSQFHKSKTLDNKYMLGDEIGKGAYGRVYIGLDLENGDFVAIKQVSLENIGQEDLNTIMQEIDLLKNLNHKNIVKYLGSLKTKTHLHIILEYVENGSLANIIKPNKFGPFPESLVTVYIAQVLEGLVYLHEQGVIHRDIKGANILTTKEGLVKLADFGVATKLNEADFNTHSVVGTPYWMAPEVIELSGVCAASDIWSVGCTIIELLTCVPPYYDLQPMPALYRIVQDDTPPIPDSLSPDITDFLRLCFKKDSRQRPDAKTLLSHPWIRNSRRALRSSLRHSGTIRYMKETDSSSEKDAEGSQEVVESVSAEKVEVTKTNSKSKLPVIGGASFRSEKDQSSPSDLGEEGTDSEDDINSDQGPTLSMHDKSSRQSGTCSISSDAKGTSQDVLENHEKYDRDEIPGNLETEASEGRRNTLATKLVGKEYSIQSSHSFSQKGEDGLRKAVKTPSSFGGNELTRFSDPPGDASLHDLFHPLDKVPEGKTNEASTSTPTANVNQGDSPVADGGKNDLATKLRARIAQKQMEGETGHSQDGGDLFRLMMGVLKDDVLNIDDLVFDEKVPPENLFPLQAVEFSRLVSSLRPDESEDAIVTSSLKLVAMFRQRPGQKAVFVTQNGFLPLMDLLDIPKSRVICAVLQLINEIVKDNTDFLENACLVGLIPLVMSFAGFERDRSREIRKEAAYFLQQLCQSSPLTLQMFISCRGIPVLVGFLEADYAKHREMVHLAIDGMWQVFKLKKSTSRNDFCRIAAKNGILLRLVNTLYSLSEATRLASISGDALILDGQTPRARSGQLDPNNPIFSQRETSPSVIDHPDGLKTRNGGGEEPSHALTSNSQSSDVHQPDALHPDGDRPRLSSVVADATEDVIQQHRISLSANRTSTDKLQKLAEGASNGFPVTQPDQVRPLLSLLEKEPPSRKISGQLDYVKHIAGIERHESRLPLLYASDEKKTNGDLEFIMAEFAEVSGRGKENGNLDTAPRYSSKTMTKKVMAIERVASTCGIASQTASGVLSDVSMDYLEKVADLLLEFARAETTVKSYMCSQSLLSRLFQMFNRVEPPILLKILECTNHLSTDPNCLENLQRADAIKQLIPNLELKEGPLVYQIHHEVLSALFNLCKINKRRQEQAAENGIIPHLMLFVMSDSPLKQYALPLLCDMAHASRNSREQLRAHGGLDVYLSLLDDEYWSVIALDSIAVCLAQDVDQKVEQAFLKKDAIQKLVNFFQNCPERHFVHILEPFLKIITKSSSINKTLALNGLTPLLIARLDHQDAIARLNLLKLIKAVYEKHPKPKQLIVENDLPQKLQNLIEERRDGQRSGGQVLVKQMATSLLKALHINTIL
ncbi:Protein kinase domain [Arabidopsis suecica]|uniref:non-specific serine/threonine protein kinase n=2 Tax=Arabidopsis TaxID=3701 RepID=A0A1I9LPC2_ARATH|nr:mitogen-activated protein kinase kinase kinase 6 [Arabidopsis thaliana]ANM64430.1 mitogen-activated protein kinase kinase kinase 6 [Arabidopsis thaliana]KAG7630476.1 Protein kinase domain [Arabidopsis suecica]|eukprot:NP_001326459.1 mitogen-activated protein kinase kinase kinase 6 [Arabidopsis thaliana]